MLSLFLFFYRRSAIMWSFLRDHNYKATKHVTTNMILAAMTMMTSVFAYGFENSVLGAVQAMDGKHKPNLLHYQAPCPQRPKADTGVSSYSL